MAQPEIGTGTTVTFSAAATFLAAPLSVEHSGVERASIDTTHLGTTTARTYAAGDLYDPGEVTVALAFDPTVSPPIVGTPTGTLTIVYAASGTWTATAYTTAFRVTAALEERIEAEITFKLTGALTVS